MEAIQVKEKAQQIISRPPRKDIKTPRCSQLAAQSSHAVVHHIIGRRRRDQGENRGENPQLHLRLQPPPDSLLSSSLGAEEG
eukprot:4644076-Heterocapsa_arctica.AAC.1